MHYLSRPAPACMVQRFRVILNEQKQKKSRTRDKKKHATFSRIAVVFVTNRDIELFFQLRK